MAFLRFINLAVLFVRLCLRQILTTTAWHHILYTYLSPSLKINSRSRTLLVLRTGPRRITITIKSRVPLTLVHCLCTNVPLDETIQICLDKLYALPDPPTLPRSVLKVLLEFPTKKSHFIFNGQYYDQIDGVAMGSPLGPVLANLFMCHFDEKWVLNNNVRPSVWFRYVDDTFTLFDNKVNKNTATQFLHYLNNCHANIKFTVEFEENSTIDYPFLGHSHQTTQSHFLNIYSPKEDLYRPVHKMGLLHT